MSARYVIMANGRGTRWADHGGIPKHLIEFEGETLLERITRQVLALDADADVVVSSSNPEYDTPGARRHAPRINEYEIDRFVPELFIDGVCFLYGDTLYSNEAMERIITTSVDDGMTFFGDERGIVAVRAGDAEPLRYHFERVRDLFIAGEIPACRGWQLYQSYAGLPFGAPECGEHFHVLEELTVGFNTPAEFHAFGEGSGVLQVSGIG